MKPVVAVLAALALAGAAQAASPHAQARASLSRCQAALAKFHLVARTKQSEPSTRTLVVAAQSACGDAAALRKLAARASADEGLQQAVNAEVGIADGLANYLKYLGDVAHGDPGHKQILSYAAEEVRQGRLLLVFALSALK